MREVLSGGRVLALDIRPDEMFVHGDAAYEIGEYDETVQMAGEEPMTLRNFYALRWERGADGVWRIDRFLGAPREAPAEM